MKKFLDVFRHLTLVEFLNGAMVGTAFLGLLVAVWVAMP